MRQYFLTGPPFTGGSRAIQHWPVPERAVDLSSKLAADLDFAQFDGFDVVAIDSSFASVCHILNLRPNAVVIAIAPPPDRYAHLLKRIRDMGLIQNSEINPRMHAYMRWSREVRDAKVETFNNWATALSWLTLHIRLDQMTPEQLTKYNEAKIKDDLAQQKEQERLDEIDRYIASEEEGMAWHPPHGTLRN